MNTDDTSPMPYWNYRPYPDLNLRNFTRKWMDNRITRAPIWCSVDLRDGNQALVEPMSVEQKETLFKLLVALGFKEIEVGFPSSSETDYLFVRKLIEENMIPEDVTIQVLTQSREDLIKRTAESVKGAEHVILHLYNSTSELQRRVVFRENQQGVKKIAKNGAHWCKSYMKIAAPGTKVQFEYSPESFTGTEPEYALEVCDAVNDIWEPSTDNPTIINLPATVEMSTPNIFADYVQWMGDNLTDRDSLVLSVHPHNDRGTAVAAAELAMMAGAERVEGCLFGNGERTGNVCLVTLALNLFSQGINPHMNLSNIDEVKRIVENCTAIPVHERHPYAGDLVYTAFSGSHQDAINKGFQHMEKMKNLHDPQAPQWEVPYLPIDPQNVGRTYEAVIRVNSQSGKGGVAYVMKNDYGLELPRGLQIELSQAVQREAERHGSEVRPESIIEIFSKKYLVNITNRTSGGEQPSIFRPYTLENYNVLNNTHEGTTKISAEVAFEHTHQDDTETGEKTTPYAQGSHHEKYTIEGEGAGPLDAFCSAAEIFGTKIEILNYHEHSRSEGTDAEAACYTQCVITDTESGKVEKVWGVGVNASIITAGLESLLSAMGRFHNSHAD